MHGRRRRRGAREHWIRRAPSHLFSVYDDDNVRTGWNEIILVATHLVAYFEHSTELERVHNVEDGDLKQVKQDHKYQTREIKRSVTHLDWFILHSSTWVKVSDERA